MDLIGSGPLPRLAPSLLGILDGLHHRNVETAKRKPVQPMAKVVQLLEATIKSREPYKIKRKSR
jgi:hypothetical protein